MLLKESPEAATGRLSVRGPQASAAQVTLIQPGDISRSPRETGLEPRQERGSSSLTSQTRAPEGGGRGPRADPAVLPEGTLALGRGGGVSRRDLLSIRAEVAAGSPGRGQSHKFLGTNGSLGEGTPCHQPRTRKHILKREHYKHFAFSLGDQERVEG